MGYGHEVEIKWMACGNDEGGIVLDNVAHTWCSHQRVV